MDFNIRSSSACLCSDDEIEKFVKEPETMVVLQGIGLAWVQGTAGDTPAFPNNTMYGHLVETCKNIFLFL